MPLNLTAITLTATLVLGISVTACTTGSVINLGDNRYGITTHNDLRDSLAGRQAENRASEYCKRRDLEMQALTHNSRSDPALGEDFARYELVFSCVAPGSSTPEPGDATLEKDLETLEKHDRENQELMNSL